MFGISFSEFILIAIISVIVFGPEQLPTIAKKLGSIIGYVQNKLSTIQRDIYQEFNFDEIKSIQQDLTKSIDMLKSQVKKELSFSHSISNFANESSCYQQNIYYQPELDFDHQPELFDDIDDTQ